MSVFNKILYTLLRKLSFLVLLCLVATSCSQFSTSPTSKAWHNMNAKFNASIDAKDYYEWAMHKIDSTQLEDYSTILPVLHKIDSNQTAVAREELDEVIRLTSLIAERHSNSKYLDKSYLLLGKARLFKGDFINATEVFKYLNANNSSETAKQQALIWLMRAYIESNDFNRAEEVSKTIAQAALSKTSKAEYFEIKAAFHQKKEENALAAVFLEEALKYMKKSTHKARAYYVAGQLYSSLQRGSLARNNWKKVVKNKPTYDLEFNAGIEILMLGNSIGANATANFLKMLDDRKNIDLKDKIYFKMGEAKEKNGDYKSAIRAYTQSVKLASNKNQSASAYLKIAEIYHTKLQDYEMASSYYDSTLFDMNTRMPRFQEITDKASSLADFVKYQKVLKMEDSLQNLAAMNPIALENKVEQMIEADQAKELKIRAEAQKLLEIEKNRAISGNSGVASPGGWLFYDNVALTRSRSTFIRVWGNRALEDNWRRSSKETGSIAFSIEKGIVGEEPGEDEAALKMKESAKRMAELESKKSAMLSQVPNSPVKLAVSRRKQEEAYYQLGKIYRLQFNEIDNAKKTFQILLDKFPETQYKQETLYFMALMAQNQENNPYKEALIKEYPLSSYARHLKRGKVEITADTESNAEKDYTVLYTEFKAGNVSSALEKAEKGLFNYTGTSLEDKYAMLRIMLLAKSNNQNTYRIALMDFMKSYPTSNLVPRVSDMLAAISK